MKIKLSKFRVQNYRCINDSGWIGTGDITALVGVNEAGKTTLLNALHMLNPGSGNLDINTIRDFPRERVATDFNENYVIAEGHFLIPKEYLKKKKLIEKFNLSHEEDLILILERKYNKILYYGFKPQLDKKKHIEDLKKILKDVRRKINRKQIDENAGDSRFTEEVRKNILLNIDGFTKKIEDSYDPNEVFTNPPERQVFANLLDSYVRDLAKFIDKVENELNSLLDFLEDTSEEMRGKSLSNQLFDNIKEDLPIFVYFEDYNVLNGSVVIPDLIKAISGDLRYREFKIQETLFKHVGLNPKEIFNLGVQKESDGISKEKQADLKKRKIILDAASQIMTKTLNNFFRERNYDVEYNVDGQFLEILISDEERPSKINLEERSKGFRWYFSFFLTFLVESKESHKNAVLLLDEPGIHLHLQAQFNLVDFFKKLKETNQIIYTTHSPFLIDENHLEQVRSVYENENGKTVVTEDSLIPDKKSIFPLQAALSYRTSQIVYRGLKQLLVENETDYYYIKTINLILAQLGKETLHKDILVIPCKNATNIECYARLFVDLENYPIILLDSDEEGRKAYSKLTKSLFSTKKNNVIKIGDIINHKQNSEFEDLIGKEILVKILNNKKLVSPLVSVSELNIEDETFVKSLKIYCKKKKIKLEANWRHQLSILLRNDFKGKDTNFITKKITQDKIDVFEKLIKTINKQINSKD